MFHNSHPAGQKGYLQPGFGIILQKREHRQAELHAVLEIFRNPHGGMVSK
jgi:hypothetical protein